MIRKSNRNILRIKRNITSQKKHPDGLRLRSSYSNQHRSAEGTEFRTRNNANTFKLQRKSTNALRYKFDPSENVVNLSKHSFSFHMYKLLNKNLNFIPISKRYNKNQLSSDLQNFFRLNKLRVHFKDETCIATVNQHVQTLWQMILMH